MLVLQAQNVQEDYQTSRAPMRLTTLLRSTLASPSAAAAAHTELDAEEKSARTAQLVAEMKDAITAGFLVLSHH
jgi:hypothetical protein